MSEPKVTAKLAAAHGLSREEYQQLGKILGRTPTYTELGIAAALWSERCASKTANVVLQKFPTTGDHVLQGPGENAGAVDIGHGWIAVFKIESHNQASFVDPYRGAAAAVGGILRDVFTMGARPIAGLDVLRFGHPEAPRMRELVDGVVRGIGDYSNAVGIPTIGGEAGFHRCYNGNILVNVFALGLARRERMVNARATGPGNVLFYAGSPTGRDGIHGARPVRRGARQSTFPGVGVEVPDAFTEKCLLEACLQAMRTGAVVAMQDMGAAGLSSTAFEMASRGGTGFRLDLDQVPLRQADMTPYEVMLSESQERMLLVVDPHRLGEVEQIFARWNLEMAAVGEVTDDGVAAIVKGDKKAATLPVRPLVQGRPMYRRPVAVPAALAERQKPPEVPPPEDPAGALKLLLGTPELGCKGWIWRQFDRTMRANTVLGPGGDAGVLLLKGTPSGLAVVADVNPVYCALDPHRGGIHAVAEAVRNLACVGAEPVGLSDCLNFGHPEDPAVSWQFRECVQGMAAACRALDVPVVSGDVSFYNDTEGRSIHPTPTVAMVGMIPDLVNLPVSHFTHAGDRIVLLGRDAGEFGGSAYLRLVFDLEQGRPPEVDLGAEERLADLLRVLAFEGMIRTAHDLAEGGLAVALAEACLGRGLGAEIRIDLAPVNLFSETQARAIVAVPPAGVDQVLAEAEDAHVPAVEVGAVGGTRLIVHADGATLEAGVEELHDLWSTALPRALEL